MMRLEDSKRCARRPWTTGFSKSIVVAVSLLALVACGDDPVHTPRAPAADPPPLVPKDVQARLCPGFEALRDVEGACDGMEDDVSRMRLERCDGTTLDILRPDAWGSNSSSGPGRYVISFVFHDFVAPDGHRAPMTSLQISFPGVTRTSEATRLPSDVEGASLANPLLIYDEPFFGVEDREIDVELSRCEDRIRVFSHVERGAKSSFLRHAKIAFSKRCAQSPETMAYLPYEVTFRGCVVLAEPPLPSVPGELLVSGAPDAGAGGP